jgi:hypothetical protein
LIGVEAFKPSSALSVFLFQRVVLCRAR